MIKVIYRRFKHQVILTNISARPPSVLEAALASESAGEFERELLLNPRSDVSVTAGLLLPHESLIHTNIIIKN